LSLLQALSIAGFEIILICLFIYLLSVYLSIYLSIYLSSIICPSIHPPTHPSIHPRNHDFLLRSFHSNEIQCSPMCSSFPYL
jgi:hypothetical protein